MKKLIVSYLLSIVSTTTALGNECLDKPEAEHVIYIEKLSQSNADVHGLLKIIHQKRIVLVPTVAADDLYYYNLLYPFEEVRTQDPMAIFDEINGLDGIGYFCKPPSKTPGAVTGIN